MSVSEYPRGYLGGRLTRLALVHRPRQDSLALYLVHLPRVFASVMTAGHQHSKFQSYFDSWNHWETLVVGKHRG